LFGQETLRFLTTVRDSWALLIGIAVLMLGHGLQGTLVGVRAGLEGFPPAATGVVMSGYYVGLLLGSFSAPRLVAQVGHVRVFAALLALASTAALFHALYVAPVAWFAVRLLTGYCFAGVFIVAESWLNGAASNQNRGGLLSLYMVIQLAALALGQFLMNLGSPSGFPLFALASVLISVASVPMLLTRSPAPAIPKASGVGLRELFRVSPLGVVGIVGVGFSNSALYGMGPVYAQAQGLSVAAISTFMASIVAGGMLLQWPMGRLSDRFDRRHVIAAVTLLAGVAAFASLPFGQLPPGWLLLQFAVIGGLSLPMYAICAAHTNDFLAPEQMVGASGALLLAYGLGAALGPTGAATVMQGVGSVGYTIYLGGVHLAIGAFALWRMTRRPSVAIQDRAPYVPVTTPSPVVTGLTQVLREESRAERAESGLKTPVPATA
jgi:MFS family permease